MENVREDLGRCGFSKVVFGSSGSRGFRDLGDMTILIFVIYIYIHIYIYVCIIYIYIHIRFFPFKERQCAGYTLLPLQNSNKWMTKQTFDRCVSQFFNMVIFPGCLSNFTSYPIVQLPGFAAFQITCHFRFLKATNPRDSWSSQWIKR